MRRASALSLRMTCEADAYFLSEIYEVELCNLRAFIRRAQNSECGGQRYNIVYTILISTCNFLHRRK